MRLEECKGTGVGLHYSNSANDRIRSRTDVVLGEEQCGFRNENGCVDQFLVVRQLCAKFLAKMNDLFWAFMDLEKAYDRVDRDALRQVLRLYRLGEKLLKAVQSFYVDSKA